MDRDSLKTLAPYFMDRIYQELRELILEAEEDQKQDTGEAAVALLRQWLETHTENLLQRKGVG